MSKRQPAPRPPTQRQIDLAVARKAGYDNDQRTFLRTYAESRVSYRLMWAAFVAGAALRRQEQSA